MEDEDKGMENCEWTSESFAEIVCVHSLENSISETHASDLTQSQRNALKLRNSANPNELTTLLSEIWVPNTEPLPPFSFASGKGTVHNLDISELIFFSENICKKLISFIGFHQTNWDAKVAAMDVFIWLCTKPELVESWFVKSEDVCNWMIRLTTSKNPIVVNVGLRGMTNLIDDDDYRKMIQNHDKFLEILDADLSHESEQMSSIAFLCMIFCEIFKRDGKIKDQDQFLSKLEKRINYSHRESLQETYWTLSCLLAATVFSEQRSELMPSFWNRCGFAELDASFQNQLIDDCLDLYLELQSMEDSPLLVREAFRDKNLVGRIFERLDASDPESVNQTLMLLTSIAADQPIMIYENFLQMHFETLIRLLDTTDITRKKRILDFFHGISKLSETLDKQSPDREILLKFVKLLKVDIDEQIVDILSFIWTRFENAEDVFIDADILPLLLSIFSKKERVSENIVSKVEGIVPRLFQHFDYPSEKYDHLSSCLKQVMSADSTNDFQKLHFALRVCLCLVSRVCTRPRSMIRWLIDEGLEIVFRRFSEIDSENYQESLLITLIDIMHEIVEKLHELDLSDLLSKTFVLLLKTGDVFCSFAPADFHVLFLKHFSAMASVKYVEIAGDIQLQKAALILLRFSMISTNESLLGIYGQLQLQVFIEEVLKKSSERDIISSTVFDALATKLSVLDVSKEKNETNQLYLRCIALILSRENIVSAFFVSLVNTGERSFIDLLISLYCECGTEIELSKEQRRNIMECISGRRFCSGCRSKFAKWWKSVGSNAVLGLKCWHCRKSI